MSVFWAKTGEKYVHIEPNAAGSARVDAAAQKKWEENYVRKENLGR